jgi:hypothetical protein
MPISEAVILQDPDIEVKLIDHYKHCQEKLRQRQREIIIELEKLISDSEIPISRSYSIPAINPANSYLVAQLKPILKDLDDLHAQVFAARIAAVSQQLNLIRIIITQIEYLTCTPSRSSSASTGSTSPSTGR